MPLSLEVALGYLRSRPSRLVSSVSLLSIGGIALGVAALVVAMGLLSGYRDEVRSKLIGANAEVVVYPLSSDGIAAGPCLEPRTMFDTLDQSEPAAEQVGNQATEKQADAHLVVR